MWSAVVVIKSIDTGGEIYRIRGLEAEDRNQLEAKIAECYDWKWYKHAYYIADITSPIGKFYTDPSGWDAINLRRFPKV